jgi:hypothetical protein
MHLNSELLFLKYAKQYFLPKNRVIEIGPDKFPSTYQEIVKDATVNWDTLDLYQNDNLTYCVKEEYVYPITDNYYDIVLSAQVLEHIRKIWVWIKELARICNKGGYVIIINPVSWIFHEAPIDCWRAYPEGMKALYGEAGLEVVLSVWESLEIPNYRRYIPGISLQNRGWKNRVISMILGKFGWPVERSYDTITIGRKI